MIVLGISPLDKDSTVSIVVDGKLVFAAGEERFTRIQIARRFSNGILAGWALAIQEFGYPTSTSSPILFLIGDGRANCLAKI
jgi:hypothetical protein